MSCRGICNGSGHRTEHPRRCNPRAPGACVYPEVLEKVVGEKVMALTEWGCVSKADVRRGRDPRKTSSRGERWPDTT